MVKISPEMIYSVLNTLTLNEVHMAAGERLRDGVVAIFFIKRFLVSYAPLFDSNFHKHTFSEVEKWEIIISNRILMTDFD